MFNIAQFSDLLNRAVDIQDAGLLETGIDQLSDRLLSGEETQEGWEEDVFQVLINVIRRPDFLSMDGGWKLLFSFKVDWEWLSEGQKQRLLLVLEETYPRYSVWMSCFLISGLLGEQFNDERALSVLSRLAKVEAEMPRSFVPHGLEHLATDSENPTTSREAFRLLCAMQDDPSEKVRGEVEVSLACKKLPPNR